MGQLTREVVSSLGVLAEERGQRLDVDDVATGVVVAADRLVLREAITNIVDNAIKYSGRSSTIEIQVRSTEGQVILTVAAAVIGALGL